MSRATAYRLLRRYQMEGWDGLRDRPPIAKRCPHRLSGEAEAQILALRRQTGWGPRSLSAVLGWPPSTIWRVLCRYGVSRAERAPRPPANRYEYAAPGELVHLDAKKLGRFWQIGKHVLGGKRRNPNAGWQHAHVAVDDHSRWGLVELRPREDAESCTAFLASVIGSYAEQGITIRRVLTDNGAGYRSRRFRALLTTHGIRHIQTSPTRPAPTAKPKRSSASCNGNGHTPSSTPPPATAPAPCPAGSGGTTSTDHTAASAATHPSAASHTLRGPTASPQTHRRGAQALAWYAPPSVISLWIG
jgi:hypothetical protein